MEKKTSTGRRNFLKAAAAGTAAMALNPGVKSVFGATDFSPSPCNKWPGRVVINFNKDAVSGNEVDVAVNIKMIEQSIKLLTGKEELGAAWKAVFPDTLSADSIIAIKIVAYNPYKSGLHWSCAKAVFDGLRQMDFDGTPFSANNIYIYEMSTTGVANAFTVAGYTAENFPDIPSENIVDVKNPVDGGDGALNNRKYAQTLKNADFLINCFNARGHILGDSDGKFTLGFKSHFGSYHDPWGMHDSNGGVSKNIRELVCTGPVYNKQVLSICASPFGANEGNGPGGINGDDLPPDDFSTYTEQMDSGCGAKNPSTVIMSTDPVSAEMQGIKMIRINEGGKYSPSDLPGYLKSSAGIDASGYSPTYNIGICDEENMEFGRIINDEIIDVPTSIHRQSAGMLKNAAVTLSAHPIAGNRSVFMEFRLPQRYVGKEASLAVFTMRGSLLHTLSCKVAGVNNHCSWNLKNNHGNRVPHGRYVVRLACGAVRHASTFSIV